jgi:hypothetical protein
MIVKRVTEALRRQDWVAVAIEFVLVVAGVLLAFQISEWATEREGRVERAAATERLLAEAEQTVAYFRAGVESQQALIGDLDYALGNVQRGTWRSADKARMTRGLQRVINAASPAPPSSVYDDLVASGEFGRIGDTRLRTSIANYRATLAFNQRYIDYFRQRMPQFENYEPLRYVFAPSKNRRVRLQVDYPKLAADPELQEALALAADGQFLVLQVRRRTLRDAEAMCVELGRVMKRSCNLHRPVPTFN